MANPLLSPEEQSLSPEQVEHLDRRRRRGQLCLILCLQFLIVATLLLLWSGQDLTYSPGWIHPMAYWNAITLTLALAFGVAGVRLRRGSNEFLSY
jgi:apolipoprotein N-acyltransferase